MYCGDNCFYLSTGYAIEIVDDEDEMLDHLYNAICGECLTVVDYISKVNNPDRKIIDVNLVIELIETECRLLKIKYNLPYGLILVNSLKRLDDCMNEAESKATSNIIPFKKSQKKQAKKKAAKKATKKVAKKPTKKA